MVTKLACLRATGQGGFRDEGSGGHSPVGDKRREGQGVTGGMLTLISTTSVPSAVLLHYPDTIPSITPTPIFSVMSHQLGDLG